MSKSSVHQKAVSVLLAVVMVLNLFQFAGVAAFAKVNDSRNQDSGKYDSAWLLTAVHIVNRTELYLDSGNIEIGETEVKVGENSIAINKDGYIITQKNGKTPTANTVSVTSGNHSIVINNVNISSSNASAFSIAGGAAVNLTLSGENKLSGADNFAGLQVPSDAAVSITGTGVLTASGGACCAGIGGGYCGTGGTITITGGSVNATSKNGAGIGGGYSGGGGTIIITGGSITATGSYGCAGIGGGSYGAGGAVTISGGSVTANGGNDGAGIGSGQDGAGGTITITGGSVNATGDNHSAGIGGGYKGAGGTVTISGGSVTANGGCFGAGIGGGYGNAGGAVTISGGSVTANGGGDGGGAGIGSCYGPGGTITISGGLVTATGGKYGAGIGGGDSGNSTTFSSGTITISGGSITANGGNFGAGIGGGQNGMGGIVTISNGIVTATGGQYGGAGIGGGYKDIDSTDIKSASGGTVYISGGSVIATGKDGASNIGKGCHGSTDGTLQNNSADKKSVYLTTVTLPVHSEETINILTIKQNNTISYGFKDMQSSSNGKLYLYLPKYSDKTTADVTAGGTAYNGYYGNVSGTANILKMDQSPLSIANLNEFYNYGDAILPSVEGGGINCAVTYLYSDANDKTYSQNVPPTKVGSYTVTASKAETESYYAVSPVSKGFTIKKAQSSVTLNTTSAQAGDNATLTATVTGVFGHAPTGSVIFKSGDKEIGTANLSDNKSTVTWLKVPAGNYALTAQYSGDINYTGSQSDKYNFNVNKKSQSDLNTSNPVYGQNGFNLNVTGGSGSGALHYKRASGTSANVDDAGNVTILGDGDTVITITKDGDDIYNPIQTTVTIKVQKATPTDKDDTSNSSKKVLSSSSSTGTVTATTSATGGTIAAVTTTNSTPVVIGSKSQINATVPTEASSVVASATVEKPAQVTISVPTVSIVEQMNSSAVQAVDLTVQVPAAVVNNTNANAKVSIIAEQAVLQAAKDTQKDVTISVINTETGNEAYRWGFKGADLASSTAAVKSVDLALTVKSTTEFSAINTTAKNNKGLVLEFANNGVLPSSATVKVYVGDKGYKPGQTFYFYYFNPTTQKLEQVGDSKTYTVDADGFVSVTIAHCSDYALLVNAVGKLVLDTKAYFLALKDVYTIKADLTGANAKNLKVYSSNSSILSVYPLKNSLLYRINGLKTGTASVMFEVYDESGKLLTKEAVAITVKKGIKSHGDSTQQVAPF